MTFDPEPYLGVVLGTQHGLLEVTEYLGAQEGGRHYFQLRCLNRGCGRGFTRTGHAILHHRFVGNHGGRSTEYCPGCRALQRAAHPTETTTS